MGSTAHVILNCGYPLCGSGHFAGALRGEVGNNGEYC